MESIKVSAIPLIADLIPEFLHNRRQDVCTILGALDKGDFETVKNLGHDLKGAGASWGFQDITDIGAALEVAAGHADAGLSFKWAGELSSYLDRVEIVYD